MPLALVCAAILTTSIQDNPALYKAEVLKWRQEQEDGLKGEEGWLTVVGLCWLEQGGTPFTYSDSGVLTLPATTKDGSVGIFTRQGDKVSVRVLKPDVVKVGGKSVPQADLDGTSTVTVGTYSMVVIQRGTRVGIRVFDSNSKALQEFKGRRWYAIDPAMKIQAKFVAHDPPRTMPITNVLGDTSPVPNPGYVEFTLGGKTCRLEAEDEGGSLFFNFKDKTSGKSTYPAGRFLYAPKPTDGIVTLDFNRAVNPPCAFTAYATCPLPSSENTLDVEVKAGELTHHPK